MKKYSLILTLILVFIAKNSNAQVISDSTIFTQLKKADSLLFERGFNNCDFEILKKLVDDSFEFYHDENGIQNREQFLNGVKETICKSSYYPEL